MIRCDFVSNSSSCSFVICGTYIDEDTLKKFVGSNNDNCVQEALDKLNENNNGLTFEPVSWGEEIAIGLDITDLNDDETLISYKQRCADAINKLFGLNLKLKDISWIRGVQTDGVLSIDC